MASNPFWYYRSANLVPRVTTLPFADMVTSKALEHVPLFALEEVLETGKAPTVEGIEDGMYEL